jgi:chromosomal replication initiator protein
LETFTELFDAVKAYCAAEISDVPYSLWIKDIEPVRLERGVAYLYVKSIFKRDIVEEKYLDLLSRAFEAVLGFKVEIHITGEGETDQPEQTANESVKDGEYEYTFATFIVGSSNKFAHAASLAVASNPSSAYNPLFIHGGSGLGKTHLLYAIRQEILDNNPQATVVYVKGEEFTNEVIEAIAGESTRQLRDKYRTADVLLMDDIHFIGGKESTQEEFFNTFNALYEAGRQIVLTSDRPPKEIRTLEERLRTRFEWGLLADVTPPDFETRIAIIRRKAELLDMQLPDEVAEYIANRLKNNIRQLEGAVKKMKAYKMLTGTPPSLAIAQNAIRDILNDSQPVSVTVERIIHEVSRTFEVSPTDIRSSKRAAPISTARQVAMYVVREVTDMSMSNIGKEFGDRDHSTVVYAINQVVKNCENDAYFKNMVEDILKNSKTI